MLKAIALIMLFLFNGLIVYSQEATSSAGGESTGTGGSVNYTYGQVFYCINSGFNASVSQGVQHPYEISVITALRATEGITASLTAFPNPTRDRISLQVKGMLTENIIFVLCDIQGKLIVSQTIVEETTIIPLGDFASGIYFLKVISNNKELKVFKIIKN